MIDRLKKTTTIFFLLIYCVLTVGMTVSTHFCGGKVTSVQVLPFFHKEDACGCDDTAIPDGCCKTEINTVQLNDEQIAVKAEQPSSYHTDLVIWADASFEMLYASNALITIIPTSSPPESPRPYILHCTLLI
jgi:hypothetical protein